PRAIVAAPALTYTRSVVIPPPLAAYVEGLDPLPLGGTRVSEIAVVRVESPALRSARPPAVPPAFRLASRRRTGTYEIATYRAPRPLLFRVADPRADTEARAVIQAR
ncbi:MAG: hypothetical protein M3340_20015, partial [Actinomycetota bacterium]|nr:hypothetical protein [Actinomycetota bacterium]